MGSRRLFSAVDSVRIVALLYADDGTIQCTDAKVLQYVLDVCTRVVRRLRLELNMLPSKTAVMIDRPLTPSGRLSDKVCHSVGFKLAGQLISTTLVYKHLGVMRSVGGGKRSLWEHLQHVRVKGMAVIREAWTSEARLQPILVGLGLHNCYWWPKVSYNTHHLTATAPESVSVMESRLLVTIIGAPHVPQCAARCMLGLATHQTRNDWERLRLFLSWWAHRWVVLCGG